MSAEELIPIGQVGAMISELTGRPRPHRCAVYRWTKKGFRGHRLITQWVGGRCYTTRENVMLFVRVLTAGPVKSEPVIPPQGRGRKQAIAAAKQFLAEGW